MKLFKLISFLLAIFFIMSAFTDIKNVKKSTNPNLEISVEYDDCDKFLKNYGEFMDTYIIVFKKYQANPTDMSVMSDYTELSAKAAGFSSMNTDNCSQEQLLKLAKIVEKFNKALLGL
jgi:hypothetical protein|tara:strand:+ start:217 stop:570 length:354 start_codon:yes stop_codon:yes gene_type:complete